MTQRTPEMGAEKSRARAGRAMVAMLMPSDDRSIAPARAVRAGGVAFIRLMAFMAVPLVGVSGGCYSATSSQLEVKHETSRHRRAIGKKRRAAFDAALLRGNRADR